MQKAITILNIEEGLSNKRREKFRTYIHKSCAPKIEFYDDDAADTGEEDLKKVTIQIKVRARMGRLIDWLVDWLIDWLIDVGRESERNCAWLFLNGAFMLQICKEESEVIFFFERWFQKLIK